MSIDIERFTTYGVVDTAHKWGSQLAKLLGNGYECTYYDRAEDDYPDPYTYYTLVDVKSPNSPITFHVQCEDARIIRILPLTGGTGLRAIGSGLMTNDSYGDFKYDPYEYTTGDMRTFEMRMYKSPKGTYAFYVENISNTAGVIQEKDTPKKTLCYTHDIDGNGIILFSSGFYYGRGLVYYVRNGMTSTGQLGGGETTKDMDDTGATCMVRAMDLWHGDYLSDLYMLRAGGKLNELVTIGGRSYVRICNPDLYDTGFAFQVL